LATLPAGSPILIVIVDAEAEFDWDGPFMRTLVSVKNSHNQVLAQNIFDRFGVRPIYFVDYAMATQKEGYEPLRQIVDSGCCEIGAHLQPWETPPFDEELSDRTSYSHNLPAWLQKAKLSQLTEMITSNLGVRPSVYRSGRYGIGEESAWILEALDYQIDMSVLPGIDMRPRHGPDFRKAPEMPYWFGRNKVLLEIPTTAALVGLLGAADSFRGLGVQLYDRISRPSLLKAHLPGVFAHSGLLERIVLSPEGATVVEMQRLTRMLISRGRRIFVFHYHSSSLLPGATSYVRSARDLSQFLAKIESYLEFFFKKLGGVAMTPTELRAELLRAAAGAPAGKPMLSVG
jgi:hypothetical protein